jgi:hypothetical protein
MCMIIYLLIAKYFHYIYVEFGVPRRDYLKVDYLYKIIYFFVLMVLASIT